MNLNFWATAFLLTLLTGFTSQLRAQDFFGKWTLDWNSAMRNDEVASNQVAESFINENMENTYNPVWVLSKDSLEVFQNGKMIRSASIVWKDETQFEILSKGKKSKTHIIEKVDDQHIKMRSRSSESILLLRRL